MSVILGVKTKETIVIASDKRITDGDGAFSDDNRKLFEVNKYLAFAGAGKAVFVKGVQKRLNETVDKDIMTIDDLFEIANTEYKITKCACALKKNIDSNFVDDSNSCCCFIAGLDKSNTAKLIFAHDVDNKGKLTFIEPPYMISVADGVDLLNKNIKAYPLDFGERTIREIAKINKLVSTTGDKWTFDVNKKRGKLESF